ncbi:MAG TPA: L,D-transpeptidase [Microthrixaceae bacterium]|nr:L,D-transpeptidase [Microthrixaceae bacterium]
MPRPPTTVRLPLTVAVALAMALVTALLAGCSDETIADAEPATTTTIQPTTTTVARPGPNETVFATAIVTEITAYRDLPADAAATGTPMVDRAAFAPVSVGPRADVPIPSIDLGAGTRYATDTGWVFVSPTSFGAPTTFVVTEDRGDWLRVQVPVRPNGSEAWIRAAEVSLSRIDTRIEVSIGERRLRALRAGQVIVDTLVVVGAPKTPTPTGRFYITDQVAKPHPGAYGPFVLPVSAFSQAMDQFAEGAPMIALHGTNHPELVGTSRSNGCIRLPNDMITRLRNELPLGTPVDIRA